MLLSDAILAHKSAAITASVGTICALKELMFDNENDNITECIYCGCTHLVRHIPAVTDDAGWHDIRACDDTEADTVKWLFEEYGYLSFVGASSGHSYLLIAE